MLVSAKEMLRKARQEGYAIGAFNFNNMEWIKAILTAAQNKQSPVILQITKGTMSKYMCGIENVVSMVRNIDKNLEITVPVALHLDHGSYEDTIECIHHGFTSVMFDGSKLDFAENLRKSKEIIELAHKNNISVECEVGGIGGQEEGHISSGELANPLECKKLMEIGADFIAAGIGNIHGEYPSDWKGIDFDLLTDICERTNNTPLVLHGGSGIPKEQVLKAIELGIAKINIHTENQIVFAQGIADYCKDHEGDEKWYEPRQLMSSGSVAIQKNVENLMDYFFKSSGKAKII